MSLSYKTRYRRINAYQYTVREVELLLIVQIRKNSPPITSRVRNRRVTNKKHGVTHAYDHEKQHGRIAEAPYKTTAVGIGERPPSGGRMFPKHSIHSSTNHKQGAVVLTNRSRLAILVTTKERDKKWRGGITGNPSRHNIYRPSN